MNKSRFKGGVSAEDTEMSLNVLFYSFFNSIISMSPFVPFIAEYFYQDLRKVITQESGLLELSVHLL
jgi:isoleucyl-tRNA synthetase